MAPEAEPVVRVANLTKRFRRADGSTVTALDDVSFDVPPGEMVILVGPSGCGKTTLLRSIAGLESPDRGHIAVHGQACFDADRRVDLSPERRRVSMVFQSYALWPHLTAVQNVAYPLRSGPRPRPSRAEAHARARETLALVGIGELAGQHPHQMSGGQRQRVALARALVAGTDLVLFDEPLSNVDARVRTELRLELLAMQRDLGFSAVFVTHDQDEAMELAHRIVVMDHGRIAQMGSPHAVYDEPTSHYVATFIGTANELAGRVTGVDPVRVATAVGEVTGRSGPVALRPGDEVVALWRPERTTILTGDEPAPAGPNRWAVTVEAARYLGSHTRLAVLLDGHRLEVWRPGPVGLGDGEELWIGVDPADVLVLPNGEGSP